MDNSQLSQVSGEVWLAVVLGILASGTVFLEIFLSGSATTKTETTLFSILQFVFSLGFAWILSRLSFRREFEAGQKRFAIAAYRRIREIDRTAGRLLAYVSQDATDLSTADHLRAQEVVKQIGLGIQDTVRSSTADWTDLIGEEIATIERIEEIHSSQAILLEHGTEEVPASSVDEILDPKQVITLKNLQQELQKLVESLPAPLRESERERWNQERKLLREQERLSEILERDGHLELSGFWEPDGGFDIPITEVPLGEKLQLEVDDAGSRVGAIIAHTKIGKRVGVITNVAEGLRYREFIDILVSIIHSSRFSAELIQVLEQEADDKRIYFIVRTLQSQETDKVL